jgi:AcrR family transcriptional regulator
VDAGLRERKKRQTRNALIASALTLFHDRGYERTTTEEIAAAVDVSQRTLFRYFANKDEIVLAVLEEIYAAFLTKLRDRPAAEAPLEAMRGAIRAVWRDLNDPAAAEVRAAIATTLTLADSVPALFAANLRRLAEWEERLVTVVAERAGTDPATDPRPLLVVAAFDTVFRVSQRRWSAGRSGDLDALLEIVERHFDELPAALGPWT